MEGCHPARYAFGHRWNQEAPTLKDLIKVTRRAFKKAGKTPKLVTASDDTVARLNDGEAAWLHRGSVAVVRPLKSNTVRIVAGCDIGVSVNHSEPVPLACGSAVEVVGKGKRVTVRTHLIGGCIPVPVRKTSGYDDLLLTSPGINLAVTDQTKANGWTDAIVITAEGNFLCTGCRFTTKHFAEIHSHFHGRLVGTNYTSLLPTITPMGGTTPTGMPNRP